MTLSRDDLGLLYKRTLLVRLCEQQIMKEYFQDEMKTPVHLGIGAEAISVGVHFALPTSTQYFGTYRNHALYLSCTDDTDGFFAEMYGKVSGCGKGKAGSMHMSNPEKGMIATSAVVGTTIPVAAGAALASQYKQDRNMVACFFGDGACEEGVFFETLNFSALKKLPILFICEDNDLAIHSTRKEREAFSSLGDVVRSFQVEYDYGDGTDMVDIVSRCRTLLARMQTTGTPGLLHLKYFRFLEHVGPLEDFDKGYRTKPEQADKNSDPLLKLEVTCLNAGWSAQELAKMKTDLLARIAKSVDLAKAAPFPAPAELFTDIFSEPRMGAH